MHSHAEFFFEAHACLQRGPGLIDPVQLDENHSADKEYRVRVPLSARIAAGPADGLIGDLQGNGEISRNWAARASETVTRLMYCWAARSSEVISAAVSW